MNATVGREMKKKTIIAWGLVFLLPVLFAGYRVVSVAVYLRAQEKAAREAFRAAPAGALLSNAPDGAERFVKTGRLLLEPAYLADPAKMRRRQVFPMRLNPRVSRGNKDGWVGQYNGRWYVKID